MLQHTLVSLYNRKPSGLISLVASCNGFINLSPLKDAFIPYKTEQLHGTLIGLEAEQEKEFRYNANLCFTYKQKVPVKLDEIENVISDYIPMQIRFGGYTPGYAKYKSQNKLLYERSFIIDTKQLKVVLMGWPFNEQSNDPTDQLWSFRNAMHERCNIAHKYQNDNDYYIVLGDLKPDIKKYSILQTEELESSIREYLSLNSLIITINSNDIAVAHYKDSRLPRESTQAMTVEQYIKHGTSGV